MAELPKGPSIETSNVTNSPGVYEHPAAGKQVIILPDGTSTAQADAVVRMGFVKVAEPPTRQELQAMQAKQAAQDAKDEKNGVPVTPYVVPGTQEQVFNGTATDNGGQGDALAAKDAEIAALRAQIEATPSNPSEPADEPVVPEAPVPSDENQNNEKETN